MEKETRNNGDPKLNTNFRPPEIKRGLPLCRKGVNYEKRSPGK